MQQGFRRLKQNALMSFFYKLELQLYKTIIVEKKRREKCEQFAPSVALAALLLEVALPQGLLSLTAAQI